jgi:hypothetical protein
LDEFITGELNKLGQSSIMEVVKQAIGFNEYFQYKDTAIKVDANSPYAKLYAEFKDVKDIDTDIRQSVEYLCREYQINTTTNVEPTQLIADYRERMASIKKRYPLLSAISKWSANEDDVTDYIRMVDITKPV